MPYITKGGYGIFTCYVLLKHVLILLRGHKGHPLNMPQVDFCPCQKNIEDHPSSLLLLLLLFYYVWMKMMTPK